MKQRSHMLSSKSVVELKPEFQKNNQGLDIETARIDRAFECLNSNKAEQKEWGFRIGVTPQYVGQLMRGEKPLNDKLAKKIISAWNYFDLSEDPLRSWIKYELGNNYGHNSEDNF